MSANLMRRLWIGKVGLEENLVHLESHTLVDLKVIVEIEPGSI